MSSVKGDVWDSGHHRKIAIVRTDGGKYGYEQQRCLITISGEGLDQPRFLSLCAFEDVRASWITEKLILIQLWLGRIAAVEAIYDVEEDKFVYRQSVTHGGAGATPAPVPENQPSPAPEFVPQEPLPLVPEGASPHPFLTNAAQGGVTYEIGVYVVKSGDDLPAIALRHQTTVKKLRNLNPELTNDAIQVGQQLRVREKPSR